ncbi:acetyl-coenzyme A transporter 1-domain-containing protein [Lipomyces tetrasporus]|uniref:Acetyl-coenzyme A transporter 1-domain-containing protein n=1 Tax=Lipomyces tetrasporus TaxID=54092 RepID=A0AAD7QPY7_9ASCO|nr:acetyl-coenzyme A transporter 1-domain-containing protein [Lipomyces tetrasporus]KAJ8097712.1 acetyl-coenzyme A transporter 1-domain-containing protein [Lipomyces tetrasporus]
MSLKVDNTSDVAHPRARQPFNRSSTGDMARDASSPYYEEECELDDLGASNFDGPHHVSVPPKRRSTSARLPKYDDEDSDKEEVNGSKNGKRSRGHEEAASSLWQLPPADFRNFALLCLLYLLQGVPVGLAMGSVPFLLKSKLSYGQVGLFSLASYPYSMKLLWSPIVDAIYSPKIGRRKSWIIPIQTVSSIMLLWLGSHVETILENAESHLGFITFLFFTLVFLCATQDVAVDGWALTLLSHANLSYASTAQTIGLNTGYFLSFTVFLAFNSPEFANKYFRTVPLDTGLLSMRAYLTFWGWAYLFMTLALFIGKTEEKTRDTRSGKNGILDVYTSMWKIVRLSNVQLFILIHLVAKFGFQANDAVTNLKLLEKGLSKEDLALTVLIDFPFEIIFGYYAAKWSVGDRPLRPWLYAFVGRLGSALLAQLLVYCFPKSGAGPFYLLLVILVHVLGSFMSTVQFVSINAFHTQIADPAIGGTYMTTLNTVSNLGGQWPRVLVLFAVDFFTVATCELDPTMATPDQIETFIPFSCAKQADKQRCATVGGVCNMKIDGYYITNLMCVLAGGALFFFWIRRKVEYLQTLDLSKWRVEK